MRGGKVILAICHWLLGAGFAFPLAFHSLHLKRATWSALKTGVQVPEAPKGSASESQGLSTFPAREPRLPLVPSQSTMINNRDLQEDYVLRECQI